VEVSSAHRVKMPSYPSVSIWDWSFTYIGDGEPPPFTQYPDFDRPGVIITDATEIILAISGTGWTTTSATSLGSTAQPRCERAATISSFRDESSWRKLPMAGGARDSQRRSGGLP